MNRSSDDPIFAPAKWMQNAHIQTLGASLPFWSPPRKFTEHEDRLRIPLGKEEDGSLVARAWWQVPSGKNDEPKTAVILVHGVGGDSGSQYVVRAAVAMHRAGYHAVRANLRGAGEGISEAPTLYHAGLTEDLRVLVDFLLKDPRVRDVAIVGFSLGGNATLKLAGEWGDDHPERIRAMCAVSPPLDLILTSRWLEKRRSFPYRRYVLQKLIETGVTYSKLYPKRATFDLDRLKRAKLIRDYDDIVVAPMHGFADADDYYRQMSSGPFLPKIRMRTLLVHAEDDPMIPADTMHASLANVPKDLQVEWTKHGGHVGFFGGFSEDSFVHTHAMQRVLKFISEG
jgi:predicted alpha/beta-fold hydrolase